MIKLIATDIDGTLIKESTSDLYPEMIKVIKALLKQGMIFCSASGRQYPSLRNVFCDLDEDIVYIAENGAQIRYKEKDISLIPMKRAYVEELICQLRKYYKHCDIIVSTPDGSLLETHNKEFIDLMTFGYRNKFKLVGDILEEKTEIIKVAIYQKESIRELGEEILIPQWKDKLKACMSGEEWVDFMDSSVDKRHAIAFLQDYFGVSKEETMVFGDNNNDIGMLQAAGESYAVENAREEVRKAAKHICPSYLEKGVYQVLKNLII